MFKIIVGDEYIKSERLGVASPSVIALDNTQLIKTAAQSDVLDYIQGIPKDPGRTRVLVIAMGAGDYYGANKNGDYFAEGELIPNHHTFRDGKFYRHHVNKDPNKAYGDVLMSFYNEPMHRVELIIDIINSKAPDTVAKVKAGIPLAVSMGCRVKYDICSICGNKAPSRSYYCDHAKFHMGDILPDGRSVYVYNPNPRFFDISEVFKPADQIGWSLKKVAADSLKLSADIGEFTEEIEEKLSTLQKTNDILKRLKGVGFDIDQLDKKFLEFLPHTKIKKVSAMDQPTLRIIIKHPVRTSLATCNSLGMPLTTMELAKLFMSKMFEGMNTHPGHLCDASHVTDEIVSNRPDILVSIQRMMFSGAPDRNLAEQLEPVAEGRSLDSDNLGAVLSGDEPKVKMTVIKSKGETPEPPAESDEEKIGMALLTMSANKYLPNVFTKESEYASRICAHYVDHLAMPSVTRRFPILSKIAEAIVQDEFIESEKYAVDKIAYYSNLIGKAFFSDLKYS